MAGPSYRQTKGEVPSTLKIPRLTILSHVVPSPKLTWIRACVHVHVYAYSMHVCIHACMHACMHACVSYVKDTHKCV